MQLTRPAAGFALAVLALALVYKMRKRSKPRPAIKRFQ